jgi:hypothetical protein
MSRRSRIRPALLATTALYVVLMGLNEEQARAEPDSPPSSPPSYSARIELFASFEHDTFNKKHVLESVRQIDGLRIEPAGVIRAKGPSVQGPGPDRKAGVGHRLLWPIDIEWSSLPQHPKLYFTLGDIAYSANITLTWSATQTGKSVANGRVEAKLVDPTWTVVKAARALVTSQSEPLLDVLLENLGDTPLSVAQVNVSALYVNPSGLHISCMNGDVWQDVLFAWRRTFTGDTAELSMETQLGNATVKARGSYRDLDCEGYPSGSFTIKASVPVQVDVPAHGMSHVKLRMRDQTIGVGMFAPHKMEIAKCGSFTLTFPEGVLPNSVHLGEPIAVGVKL